MCRFSVSTTWSLLPCFLSFFVFAFLTILRRFLDLLLLLLFVWTIPPLHSPPWLPRRRQVVVFGKSPVVVTCLLSRQAGYAGALSEQRARAKASCFASYMLPTRTYGHGNKKRMQECIYPWGKVVFYTHTGRRKNRFFFCFFSLRMTVSSEHILLRYKIMLSNKAIHRYRTIISSTPTTHAAMCSLQPNCGTDATPCSTYEWAWSPEKLL